MATRKTTAPKAKQAAPTKAEVPSAEPEEQEKAESVPETPADAVAPDAEQDAQAATTAEATEANAEQAEAIVPTEVQGNNVTGDGTGNALPPIQEMPVVFVRTKRRIKSRRRAGYRFNREGTGIALELLSKEQLKQLREDPALEVEDCTFPLEEATSEPEA